MRLLDEVKPTLPASWYYDGDHYRRELEAIWYRDWICVGRLEALSRPGDYFVAAVGDQQIIVTREVGGQPRAFHNTCRHRGSILCREEAGRFRNGRIVCPYHTWTYSTGGDLLMTPGRFETEDFEAADYSLYDVPLDIWGGFIFINLDRQPEQNLGEFLGNEPGYLENWPLADMRSVRQETIAVACNWKIFWENYSECYHCPRVHPELCKVMPVYKKGVFDHIDVAGWRPAYEGDPGLGSVGNGARTWTMSGQTSLPLIEGPTAEERNMGVMFSSVAGSMYVVGHPDYVRSVRVMPTGPESIDLVVDWLLPEDYEVRNEDDLEPIYELARLVIEQDGDVCEINQKGLHSRRHEQGILVPQEFELWHFHEWIRSKLAKLDNIGS